MFAQAIECQRTLMHVERGIWFKLQPFRKLKQYGLRFGLVEARCCANDILLVSAEMPLDDQLTKHFRPRVLIHVDHKVAGVPRMQSSVRPGYILRSLGWSGARTASLPRASYSSLSGHLVGLFPRAIVQEGTAVGSKNHLKQADVELIYDAHIVGVAKALLELLEAWW
eukprot:scaffold177799_cov30-Tisochrysis_lutea.AAC.2